MYFLRHHDVEVYNALLLAVELAALAWLLRRRGFGPACAVALVAGASAAALAVLLAKACGWGGFGAAGLLAWGVFAHGPAVLLALAALHRKTHRRTAALALTAAVAVVLVGIDAFLVEPRWLEVSRLELASDKLSRPLRVVVLADLQTDDPGPFERAVIERALAESPDLVLFPGDYVQEADPERYAAAAERLARLFAEAGLEAPLGVYAVGGNVDPAGWERVFAGSPVHAFERSGSLALEELDLTALSLADSFATDHVVPARERFHLVFGHGPDFALGDVDADLLVAGHCHGGQVRAPLLGPLVTLSRVPRRWAAGFREIRPGTWLLVSRGIGMERGRAPRLRFLCRPELVVLDLVPRT